MPEALLLQSQLLLQLLISCFLFGLLDLLLNFDAWLGNFSGCNDLGSFNFLRLLSWVLDNWEFRFLFNHRFVALDDLAWLFVADTERAQGHIQVRVRVLPVVG